MGDRTNVPKEVVFHHWARVKDTVEEGRKAGYISESDAQAMVPPDPKPGRFYDLEKNHVANYHFVPERGHLEHGLYLVSVS